LVLVAGGDIGFGREVGQTILNQRAYAPFSSVQPLLDSADLRFANLESVLSRQPYNETVRPGNPLVFTGPPEGAALLKTAGIDLVSTANNYAWDYGPSALQASMKTLSEAGVRFVGTSSEVGAAYRPLIVDVAGWRVSIFAVTEIWNFGELSKHVARDYVAGADFDRLADELETARKESDLVIVSYHGGSEYENVPLRSTREFADKVMAAGADVFLGHHPHVPHGIAFAGERPIFYSLGNFVFPPNEHRWTATSFLAKITFKRDGAIDREVCPFNIFELRPEPFKKDKKLHEAAFRAHLTAISKRFGGIELGASADHGCMPLEKAKAP
jgi:poly-gamma-glutamate synthesis protein (capsule biosynthesis protein)